MSIIEFVDTLNLFFFVGFVFFVSVGRVGDYVVAVVTVLLLFVVICIAITLSDVTVAITS